VELKEETRDKILNAVEDGRVTRSLFEVALTEALSNIESTVPLFLRSFEFHQAGEELEKKLLSLSKDSPSAP